VEAGFNKGEVYNLDKKRGNSLIHNTTKKGKNTQTHSPRGSWDGKEEGEWLALSADPIMETESWEALEEEKGIILRGGILGGGSDTNKKDR